MLLDLCCVLRRPEPEETGPTATDQPALPDFPPPDPNDDHNFRPFVADPQKQARYEKYLQLVKIGAKGYSCLRLLN